MSWLEQGRALLARGSWDEALGILRPHDGVPEALEGIGTAAWWLDDAELTVGSRERAYRLYRERGDLLGAARVACALVWDSVLFGGRPAVARGWLERARSLLGDVVEEAPEHGWLAVREAELALHEKRLDAALAAARRAIAHGRSLDREDLQVIGLALEGLALVNAGKVAEGLRRLDEAAAGATAGDVDDLMWIGKVCCFLIGACEQANDFDRAAQWCDEVSAFCRRWELQTLFSVCRTQYASVLIHRGTWDEAEAELVAALEHFRDSKRLVVGEGVARLGELRRRQGRLDEAVRLFDQVPRHPLARLGRAEIALGRGDAAAALDHVTSVLERIPESSRLARVAALELAVRAGTAAGRPSDAARWANELRSIASIGTPALLAAAAYADGTLATHAGRHDDARDAFERAVDLYLQMGAPYEEARARLALARSLEAAGLAARAREEAAGALSAFEHLRALEGVEHAGGLLSSLDGVRPSAGPLTRREVDVLRLVAAGLSNRQIAQSLVLSEHTAHRHVSNILRKLGEPTRAAASARAARDGLL